MEHSLLEPLRHFARWLFGAPFQELPPEFGDPVPPDLRAFETNADQVQHQAQGDVPPTDIKQAGPIR